MKKVVAQVGPVTATWEEDEEQTIYDDLFEEDSLGDEDWEDWEDWRDGYGNPTSPPEGLS